MFDEPEDDTYVDSKSSDEDEDSRSDGLFEAVILIIGEAGAGKSTFINLIAGKPIADTTKSAKIEQYTCIYQDKDTHHTWRLHLASLTQQ